MTDKTTTPDTTKPDDATLAALQAQLAEAQKGIEALKAKNDELLAEKKAAQQKAREEAEARQKEADEAAAKVGDIEALKKSWGEKYARLEAESAEKLKAAQAEIRRLVVVENAAKIASELAVPGSAEVLQRFIEDRLDCDDGNRLCIRDAQGKASALTLDELKKEIASDKRFAPLVLASKATGSGAAGVQTGGGAAKPSAAPQRQCLGGGSPLGPVRACCLRCRGRAWPCLRLPWWRRFRQPVPWRPASQVWPARQVFRPLPRRRLLRAAPWQARCC